MGKHIFFLVLYAILSQVYPGEVITGIFILHCVINVATNLKNIVSSINLIVFYNIGAALASIANLMFIIKVKTFGTGEDVLHIYNYIDVRYIDEGSELWVIGNTFIFIGYEVFRKMSLPSISVLMDNKKTLDYMYYIILGMTVLAVTGNVINLSFLGGGFQKIILLLLSIGTLFYSRLWVTENNNRYGFFAISLCILQIYNALYRSYIRIDLIIPICILYLGYFIGKGEVKYLFSYRIIPVILIFVIFFQFFQSLGINRAHFITAFTAPAENTRSYTYVQDDENKGGTLLERSSCIAQLTNIIRLTKEKGYYGGVASAPLLAAFVPRILWPEKPNIELGAWFALEIGAGTIGDNGRSNNSVNMTIPGEFFLDFGWIGLAIGCMFWGAILALFWNSSHFNDSQYNLTGTLWGGYLLQGAIGAFVDMQSIVTLISTYLVFLLIKKITDQYADTRHRAHVEG